MESSTFAPIPTPTAHEAIAQMDERHIFRFALPMPASIKMLQNIHITTESWLRMIKGQGHATVLQTDLQTYTENLTKLALLLHDGTRKMKDFHFEYKRKRDQWEKFVYEIILPDHDEEQKPVENSEPSKKRKTSSFEL